MTSADVRAERAFLRWLMEYPDELTEAERRLICWRQLLRAADSVVQPVAPAVGTAVSSPQEDTKCSNPPADPT